jgi:hypothetical protein
MLSTEVPGKQWLLQFNLNIRSTHHCMQEEESIGNTGTDMEKN